MIGKISILTQNTGNQQYNKQFFSVVFSIDFITEFFKFYNFINEILTISGTNRLTFFLHHKSNRFIILVSNLKQQFQMKSYHYINCRTGEVLQANTKIRVNIYNKSY